MRNERQRTRRRKKRKKKYKKREMRKEGVLHATGRDQKENKNRRIEGEGVRVRKSKKVDEEGGHQEEEKVAEIVTDWVFVKRKTRRQSRKTVQVFVKVNWSTVITMEVGLTDKVSGVVRRIPNSASGSKRDVHVTCEGECSEEATS